MHNLYLRFDGPIPAHLIDVRTDGHFQAQRLRETLQKPKKPLQKTNQHTYPSQKTNASQHYN